MKQNRIVYIFPNRAIWPAYVKKNNSKRLFDYKQVS